MTLVGSSWHVGVVSFLLQELLATLGLRPSTENISWDSRPAQAWQCWKLGRVVISTGFCNTKTFFPKWSWSDQRAELSSRLCHLVSTKGTDVLLKSTTDTVPPSHRFRQSIPQKLWRWKAVCSWRWPVSPHGPQHINKLEIKAIYTSLKWRIFQQRVSKSKCLHLVDSMVSLQILNKGRSSSHKLRLVCKKIASLLIASRILLVLSYVESSRNPADRPSRKPQKRKWGSVN